MINGVGVIFTIREFHIPKMTPTPFFQSARAPDSLTTFAHFTISRFR